MSSRIWSREDIRNILLAIYAAKILPGEGVSTEDSTGTAYRFHQWGCRAAVQSLMLAFGIPLQLLEHAIRRPVSPLQISTTSTEHWWIEDIENIIAAIYRSAASAPLQDPTYVEFYQGFGEVISAVLQSIGSRQDARRWLEQTISDRRWVFPSEGSSSVKLVGSSPEDTAGRQEPEDTPHSC